MRSSVTAGQTRLAPRHIDIENKPRAPHDDRRCLTLPEATPQYATLVSTHFFTKRGKQCLSKEPLFNEPLF